MTGPEKSRKRRKEHPCEAKLYHRRQMEQISDSYVAHLLKVKKRTASLDLLELKRTQILIIRFILKAKKEKQNVDITPDA